MYFWKIKKLKSQLVDQPLSDRESLPYVLVLAVFIQLSILASCFVEGKKPELLLDFVWVGVSCLGAFLGTLHLYRMNGGGEGQHFLQRFLAIGWVVGVRWSVLFGFWFFFLGALSLSLGINLAEGALWQDVALSIPLMVFYYWRTGVHIRDVSCQAT